MPSNIYPPQIKCSCIISSHILYMPCPRTGNFSFNFFFNRGNFIVIAVAAVVFVIRVSPRSVWINLINYRCNVILIRRRRRWRQEWWWWWHTHSTGNVRKTHSRLLRSHSRLLNCSDNHTTKFFVFCSAPSASHVRTCCGEPSGIAHYYMIICILIFFY